MILYSLNCYSTYSVVNMFEKRAGPIGSDRDAQSQPFQTMCEPSLAKRSCPCMPSRTALCESDAIADIADGAGGCVLTFFLLLPPAGSVRPPLSSGLGITRILPHIDYSAVKSSIYWKITALPKTAEKPSYAASVEFLRDQCWFLLDPCCFRSFTIGFGASPQGKDRNVISR